MAQQLHNNSIIQTPNNNNKGASSNNAYQSTFLPYFERTETKIKQLILYAYWHLMERHELLKRINEIIEDCNKKIDKELPNRADYINGMQEKSMKMVNQFYDKPKKRFIAIGIALGIAFTTIKTKSNDDRLAKPDISTPQKLMGILRNKKDNDFKLVNDMWAEAKGSVGNIQSYSKRLKLMVKDMGDQIMTTSGENGKRPISLWQKAELDIRHQNQMDHLVKLKEEGVELAYLSSHPDCSIRCQKFQGKLVSLTEHAPNPQRVVRKSDYSDLDITSYRVRKVGNEWVYSLPDILATETKGGYNNMIYGGFNCRHRLIPYSKGIKPTIYDDKDVAKQRDIETRIRAMEREIRALKQQELLFKQQNDKRNAKFIHDQVERKTLEYKAFCKKNGYAWYEYRIMI